MEKKVRVKAIVKGFVQGVGYRFFAVREARNLGVKGYVKNLPNGDVEALFECEKDRAEKFIQRLKIGPAFSKVTDIELEWDEYKDEFKGFDIRF